MKTFIATIITTAYHILARSPNPLLEASGSGNLANHILVEENSNWSDTSWFQRPPCCPCRLVQYVATLSSTTNSHVLNDARHVWGKETFHVYHHHHSICITSYLKKITTEVLHPNASDLPGLLLLVSKLPYSADLYCSLWSLYLSLYFITNP